MQVNLTNLIKPNQTVAVALSGGSDSMALLNYMLFASKSYPFNLIAINVEHGIRGENSKNDTEFVKNYCLERKIPILCYQVDSLKKAKEEKLSIEQSARALRYECFYDAINNKKCDLVATAHHQSDNAETVLFNLFRGTGLAGVTGIAKNLNGKIIRPFLSISKQTINEYISENKIPFVKDETNDQDDYTRNYLRHNVIPKILEVFPKAESSISRFAEIASLENDFIEQAVKSALILYFDRAEISLPQHPAIISRAVISALRHLGVEKDWEKAHIDGAIKLCTQKNGDKLDLKNGVKIIKEYDKLTLYRDGKREEIEIPFSFGEHTLGGQTLKITLAEKTVNLKDGLFADADKIPKTALIRTKKDGDVFTKFGGGTKKLCDYLTDKKIPQRVRDDLVLIADGQTVLAIFGVAVSEKIKVDDNTKTIIKLEN